MKKTHLLILFFLSFSVAFAQKPKPGRFNGESVPLVMGSGTSTRLPVFFKASIIGLMPNTLYKYYVRFISISDTSSATTTGAGNPLFIEKTSWVTTASPTFSTGTNHDTLQTTIAGDYRGWFSCVYNADSRFTAGKYLHPMIVLRDSVNNVTLKYYMNDSIKVLDFNASAGSNYGTGIYGTSFTKGRQAVKLYDNNLGSGRPVSIAYTESEGLSVPNTVGYYSSNVDGVTGAWGTILPNSLSLGIKRIEAWDIEKDTIVAFHTDSDGIWGTKDTTVNPHGGSAKPIFLPANEVPLQRAVIQFAARTSTVTEGNKTVEVYISGKYLDGDSSKITLYVFGGTATNGGVDYTLAPTTQIRKFKLNGSYTDTIKILLKDDNLSEGDETIILKLTSPVNAYLGIEETHTLTITDNDKPLLTFSTPRIVIKEDASFAKVKVLMNSGSVGTTSVKVVVKSTGTNTFIPTEFRLGASNRDSTITFAGGPAFDSIEFKARIFQDGVADPADTIVLVLRNPSNPALIGKDSILTIIVLDIDAPPIVSFSTKIVSVKESAGTAKIRINISGRNKNQSDFVLKYVSASSTATQGTDFTFSPTSQIRTILPTDADSIVITIPILNDNIYENTEDAVFILTNLSNVQIGKPDTLRLRIVNDDLPVYDIDAVTKVKAGTGVADSLNVKLKIRGIVYGINMRPVGSPAGTQFTIIDRTGGIQVFSPMGNKGYTVVEGDSVEASGTINQFDGMIQLGSLDTIIKLASAKPLMAPKIVTVLNETTESEFVKINMVRIVDINQWPITTLSTNTTKDIKVVNQTDTFTITIDSDTDIDGTPAPTGFLNITGIGAQFDQTSPYTSGYRLFPRKLTDIEKVNTPIFTFTTTSQTVNERFDDSTHLITISSSNLNTVVNLKLVLKSATAQNSRDYSFVFPFTVSLSPSSPTYSFKIDLDDDLISEGAVNLVLALRNIPFGSVVTDSIHTITINDNETMGINNTETVKVNVYPNPSAGMIKINSDEAVRTVSIVDIAGKEMKRVNAENSMNFEVNLQELPAGIYTVRMETLTGIVSRQITINK
ncbi:MAG: T9SS type A sorting domain-containing protein [Bacteroidia bacterium]|nr:T9SS type A sorting domain-containing protein [Bacteroidia bacterium]